ncbi:hypothetical protein L3Q82_019278 [Scortum barcoo]|uniref:Uncharacterized protein n=1 Tax=Scortum barcoo TaxID=214431 RepID=A0ACB8VD16_9TELE|nr:hypothetical protein L3Q82_019278 [Scortum barcoo]
MPVKLKKESYQAMLACGTPDAELTVLAGQASRSPGSPGGKNFGSGRSSCRWGAVDLNWGHLSGRWKEYFEDLLNFTEMPSTEEAEAGDSEVDSTIPQAEVTEVV